jgi:hypothetical protein
MTNVNALVNEIKADYNLVRANSLNVSLAAGGLAEGTNAHTIKTTSTVPFVIGGVFYSYTATDNIAITACAQQAVSTYCLYLVSINAAGTVTTTKGTAVATDTAVLPALPAASAPLGYYKIATDSSHTYTAGTTDHSAAGITATYADLMSVSGGASTPPVISTSDLSMSV